MKMHLHGKHFKHHTIKVNIFFHTSIMQSQSRPIMYFFYNDHFFISFFTRCVVVHTANDRVEDKWFKVFYWF